MESEVRMSIYATLWRVTVHEYFDDHGHEVWAQGVPSWIRYSGPGWDEWLPPPIEPRDDNAGYSRMRAVFLCDRFTTKATERCGQEYVNPLLVMTGDEYTSMRWVDLLEKIQDAIKQRRGPLLSISVY